MSVARRQASRATLSAGGMHGRDEGRLLGRSAPQSPDSRAASTRQDRQEREPAGDELRRLAPAEADEAHDERPSPASSPLLTLTSVARPSAIPASVIRSGVARAFDEQRQSSRNQEGRDRLGIGGQADEDVPAFRSPRPSSPPPAGRASGQKAQRAAAPNSEPALARRRATDHSGADDGAGDRDERESRPRCRMPNAPEGPPLRASVRAGHAKPTTNRSRSPRARTSDDKDRHAALKARHPVTSAQCQAIRFRRPTTTSPAMTPNQSQHQHRPGPAACLGDELTRSGVVAGGIASEAVLRQTGHYRLCLSGGGKSSEGDRHRTRGRALREPAPPGSRRPSCRPTRNHT